MSRSYFCWLFLLFSIGLSGCVTHRQLSSPAPVVNPKQALPHYAAIDHGHLEYYAVGKGSPIVLITGYVMDVTSWNESFLTALAKKHQLIIFNNRNVGGSLVQADHYDSRDLAKDTHQLIQALHLHKPAILGISMGGMIAQQFAVLYPDETGQLILINTAIAGRQSVHPNASTEKQMLNMPTDQLGRYNMAIHLFFPGEGRTQMALALAVDRFQPKKYTEIHPEAVMSQQKDLILKWVNDDATAKKLAHLNVPVLILNGTADEVIPPVNSTILAHTLPHTKLIRWPNGGHAMIFQYPDGLANAINDFIAETR